MPIFIKFPGRLKRRVMVLFALMCVLTVIVMYYVKRTTTDHRKSSNRPKISLLNPYEVEDDANIICLPLLSAAQVETICAHRLEDDENISKFISETSVLEASIVNNVKKILTDDHEKGLIDIGINIGMYTITAASMGHFVVGVEQSSSNLQSLAKSLRRSPHLLPFTKIVTNRISDNYELLPFKTRLTYPPAAMKSFFSEGGFKWKHKPFTDKAKKVTVESIVANDLLKVISFKRAIFKIAIGGYEIKVFIQADRLFSAIDISHVFIEWGKKGDDENEAMFFLSFFMSRGYTAHSADEIVPLEMTLEECKKWPFNVVWIKTELWAKEAFKRKQLY